MDSPLIVIFGYDTIHRKETQRGGIRLWTKKQKIKKIANPNPLELI